MIKNLSDYEGYYAIPCRSTIASTYPEGDRLRMERSWEILARTQQQVIKLQEKAIEELEKKVKQLGGRDD